MILVFIYFLLHHGNSPFKSRLRNLAEWRIRVLALVFVLKRRCNLWLVFSCRSWQSVWLWDAGGGFSGVSSHGLFDGDYRGAEGGVVLHLAHS